MTDRVDLKPLEVASELFNFTYSPSWAQEGGEDYDRGWVKDCGGKTDFDPILLWFSCRVYPDGTYICSVYLGADTMLDNTGVLSAKSKDDAKKAVESWCQEKAKNYASAIVAAWNRRAEG